MTTTQRAAAWRGRPLRAVLFDLDGTLLDTAGDITRALNLAIAESGWPPLPVDQVSRMIGRGSPMLIQRAAAARGESPTPAALDALLGRFFHHYEDLETSGESDARAYPGVDVTLRRLREADLHLAVVTNKHRRFADALLQRLDLLRWVDVIVGGDTCERRKPDPQPLLYACDSLGVAPGEALMVGDSINDVLAARAASLPIICVPYGYNEGQDPRSLPCDAMVDTLAELPALFWPPG